jgi:putative transcriptional regulator
VIAETTRGRLLVATPTLEDPNFARTVVLMLEHTDEGALGVVLNRPTEVRLAEPLPAWDDVASDPAVVFVGGPVQREAIIALGRRRDGVGDDDGDGWAPVVSGVGTVDLQADPALVTPGLAGLRIFAGYSGWGPGQLEVELEAGAWFVVDADPDDALAAAPEELWRDVLRRQKGDLAMFATFPPDPALN